MNIYALDTDIYTLYRMGHSVVSQKVAAHDQIDVLAVTVITVEESLRGWYGKLRRVKKPDDIARVYQQLADAVENLSGWHILSFPVSAMGRYDQLKAQKLNIGKQDLCIAAIVLEYNAILVTRNLRDFQRIPGLTVENWAV